MCGEIKKISYTEGEIMDTKKEPHIICLAASKHYRLRPAMTAKAWILSLVRIGDRADKFSVPTRRSCATRMKAYLLRGGGK